MIKPKLLEIGDRIAFIAASSPVPDERINPSIKAFEEMGLNVIVGDSCISKHGYLAGPDELRAKDINLMFKDKTIKGVFAIRGGYGAARLLDKIDYNMIKKNPKVFAGYSDVTILHSVFNERCKLITYHAPMPSTEFYKKVDDFTLNSYMQNIFVGNGKGKMINPENMLIKQLVKGKAKGRLTGGNLTLLCSTLGTNYEINTKGKILFIEEVDEAPYRIDRMLTQLLQAGKLRGCNGIILGSFTNCEADDKNKSLSLEELLNEIIVPLNIPTLYNVACGHCEPTMTLPLGEEVILSENGTILLE